MLHYSIVYADYKFNCNLVVVYQLATFLYIFMTGSHLTWPKQPVTHNVFCILFMKFQYENQCLCWIVFFFCCRGVGVNDSYCNFTVRFMIRIHGIGMGLLSVVLSFVVSYIFTIQTMSCFYILLPAINCTVQYDVSWWILLMALENKTPLL